MGKEKGGFLTPKAIANRIKSKGLQKLRWYCQMCQKQCRDENGFKCHCMSESHQRQLLLFAENPDKYLDSFSQEFLDDFMELLKRRFGTKRVHCNIVYQEYISERDHTHMNSTQWGTLTELVKWMGHEGHCVVDETPKGWYITYIDKDPETIERQKKMQSKDKMELDDEERMAKFLEQQIERAKDIDSEKHEIVHTELQRENEEEKVQFDFSKPSTSKTEQSSQRSAASNNPLKQITVKKPSSSSSSSSSSTKHPAKRKSALEEIVEEEKAKKKKPERQENWITKGIIIKIITKKLGDKYYKKKGVVKEVKNLFVAVVEILDSGDVLKLDQAHLETVIPQPGRLVKIVNGTNRGLNAMMLDLDEKSFSVSVKLEDGPDKGKKVPGIAYEDICKLA